MSVAREAEPAGTLHELREAGLDREDLLGMFRNMLLTRGVEERGHLLYKQGKIPGSFYTGRGNEGAAVAVATAMRPEDVGTPVQRDMGSTSCAGSSPGASWPTTWVAPTAPAAGETETSTSATCGSGW